MGHVTQLHSFQGWFVIHGLVHAMIDLLLTLKSCVHPLGKYEKQRNVEIQVVWCHLRSSVT